RNLGCLKISRLIALAPQCVQFRETAETAASQFLGQGADQSRPPLRCSQLVEPSNHDKPTHFDGVLLRLTFAFTCGPAARNVVSRKTVMPARQVQRIVSRCPCPSAKAHARRIDRRDSVRDLRHCRTPSTTHKCDPRHTWGAPAALPSAFLDPSAAR